MKRETDLTHRILQSQNGRRIIDFVAPIYNDGETALWLFESIGQILDDLTKNIDSLRQQVASEKATWTLPYWETEYNIIPESYWNEEERRAAIIAKIKYVAPVNPAKLEEFASVIMNAPCEIIENISKNTFRLIIHGWSNNFPRLRATINAAKPAHLIWNTFAEIPVIILKEKTGSIIKKDLRLELYVNYWKCYCFHGKRCFDGSILFDQRRIELNMTRTHIKTSVNMPHSFYPQKLQINFSPFGIKQKSGVMFEKNLCFKTFVNYWNSYCFKGKRFFDGGIDFSSRCIGFYINNFQITTTLREKKHFPVVSTARKVNEIHFYLYGVINCNTFGENANLTITRPSHADGTYCFDGTLRFDGKSAPQTENI